MKQYSKEDQRLLAAWALDCAKRVLPLFEQHYPQDERPRRAIETGWDWVHTGLFRMAAIRGASLAAHAAAKDANDHEAARCAAHAAGQAVATAHVPQHAYGSAYYALKAIAAAHPDAAAWHVAHEREWQSRRLPDHIRPDIMERIVAEKRGSVMFITIAKGEGF